MRRRIFIVALILLIFSFASIIMAKTPEESQREIQDLQTQLDKLQNQEKTLSQQIQYMNTQIYLTGLRIEETKKKIETTQKEIELLGARIINLDSSLDHLSKTLIKRVVGRYKKGNISFLEMFLGSSNADDLVNQVKYQKTAQNNNQKLLIQVQGTKQNYEEQKKLREDKKLLLDTLEKNLSVQKNSLDYQKTQKQILLTETQNDEVKYQQLLRQALAEHTAIENAVVSGVQVGPVKKGDPIALVGNSGAPYCSSGPHLHFEVRSNNSWVNPDSYLSSKSVEDNQTGRVNSIGNGSWDWPIQDPIVVEQHFGHTPWSWRYAYSGGVHTGVDMWSRSGDIIRAPADGTLFTSAQNCSGAIINIKYIDHGNGIISFYLHVQ